MNNFSSIYFSSCTIRDYFSKTGITHKTIWYAIKYLKKNNCKYLDLGRSKTYHVSQENIKETSNQEPVKEISPAPIQEEKKAKDWGRASNDPRNKS